MKPQLITQLASRKLTQKEFDFLNELSDKFHEKEIEGFRFSHAMDDLWELISDLCTMGEQVTEDDPSRLQEHD